MKKQLELLPQLVRELAQCLPETEGLASALHTQDFLEAERKHADRLEEDLKHLSELLSRDGATNDYKIRTAVIYLGGVWKVIHNRRAERKKYDPT